ncbi:hypothetical protein J8J14_02775 [Roseomonas sp. SSH11]|uniref:Secreted peptide n=1 Tax=Pararoseomonas baculiformis TaxID=2820812 RepID=A0ABS4A9L4_9PROT|nr:hypothetical protein [Pararoseomonas baculiformis]MBP0443691.1 hypothetical protein [Pararoseomonas baculiformis]
MPVLPMVVVPMVPLRVAAPVLFAGLAAVDVPPVLVLLEAVPPVPPEVLIPLVALLVPVAELAAPDDWGGFAVVESVRVWARASGLEASTAAAINGSVKRLRIISSES